MDPLTPGETTNRIQDRFTELWMKLQDGTATPEEQEEYHRVQVEYWQRKHSIEEQDD